MDLVLQITWSYDLEKKRMGFLLENIARFFLAFSVELRLLDVQLCSKDKKSVSIKASFL